MSFSPNPLRFRIRAHLDQQNKITFDPSFVFVKYDPRPPLEDDAEEPGDCGPAAAPTSLAVASVYIDGRDDIDTEWWDIQDVQAIGALRLAILRFHGPAFTAALRTEDVRSQDLVLLNALIDGARIQLRLDIDEHPSALFLDLHTS